MKSVYAMLFPDGVVKIGITNNMVNRKSHILHRWGVKPISVFETGQIGGYRGVESVVLQRARVRGGKRVEGLGREFFTGLDFDDVVEWIGNTMDVHARRGWISDVSA